MLGSYAPEEQRRILQDILDGVPSSSAPSLTNEADYVRIFRHLLFSAIFPHVGNPQPPWNLGCTTRPQAWQWIRGQLIHAIVRDDWPLRACLPQLRECVQHALVTWAECEYPVHLTPRVIIDFGALFSSLSSLCMRLNGWDFEEPPHCTALAKDYIAAFYLNWNDDEKRARREYLNFGAKDTDTVVGSNGEVIDPPSLTGAIVPPVPVELHEHRPRMWHSPGTAPTSMDLEQEPETFPLAPTPKRNRDESSDHMGSTAVPKRVHVEPQVVIEHHYPPNFTPIGTGAEAPEPLEPMPVATPTPHAKFSSMSMDIQRDNASFVNRHRTGTASGGLDHDSSAGNEPRPFPLDRAIHNCMLGWPDYEVLYGHPNDDTILGLGIFAEMPFPDLDPKHVFIRDGHDPVLRALHAAGAAEVPPETFRMCDGDLGLDTPLAGTGYRVWALHDRVACVRSHEWSVGLRIGNPATGTRIGEISSVNQTPPGMRKANFREAIGLLQAPGQVGVPATLSTDAHLGYAFYAYQSASVALSPGEAHRHILMRVEGTASRGGSGQSLQRAKVGFCPCCSHVTHIAVPPSYDAGSFDEAKSTCLSLWQRCGPWAGRFLAAHHYYYTYGSLSNNWDWAARTLDIATPPPLSLFKMHDPPLDSAAPQTPLHALPSSRAPVAPTSVESQHTAPEPTVAAPKSPIRMNLSSCIPESTPRDLSRFLVDDNSPPMSLSQCSDGRDLSVISGLNFPRGGHRVDPTAPTAKNSPTAKHNCTPAVRPISPSSASGYGKDKANKGKPTSKENEPCTRRELGKKGTREQGK